MLLPWDKLPRCFKLPKKDHHLIIAPVAHRAAPKKAQMLLPVVSVVISSMIVKDTQAIINCM